MTTAQDQQSRAVIAAWNAQADEYNQWETLGDDEKIEWAMQAARALPPGWQAVPVEPTRQMQSAALKYVVRQHQTRDVWRTMLAAAPQTPAAQERQQMTDEQIDHYVSVEMREFLAGAYAESGSARDQLTQFARAIEAAVAAQSQQDALDAARYRIARRQVGFYRTDDGRGPVSAYLLMSAPASDAIASETDASLDAISAQGASNV